MTSVKAAIRLSEWTRDEVSGMKLNADGVCVMFGYEESKTFTKRNKLFILVN